MKIKKKFAVLLALLMLMSCFAACGGGGDGSDSSGNSSVEYPEDFQSFLDSLDTEFSYEVDKTVSEFGDDPVLGFRSAGSPAEKETAAYIEKTMNDIGLKNVTTDKTTLDGWTFKGASITYTDADGKEEKIDLGGYQTTIQAKDETVKVIYAGKGEAADYKGLDAKDKLVLIDIDQNEEYWINSQAYQAKVKGAKAVLANSAMPVEADDRIGTQDICGPADAPALGISQRDRDALKKAIDDSGKGEIEIIFNADSKVTNDVESQNVWGEIPGRSDEVIYMMAHMDGYFHSFYDDASGIGLVLGSAKAMVDSGYTPDKTIRFICHGAEEWGKEDSQADWAIGAFQQITKNHPEWAETAFAIVNIDGAYSVEGETTFGISMSEELYSFIDPLVKPMTDESGYKYRYMMPPSTYKEDFNYMASGIPSVATAKGEETLFYDTGYHTSYDSEEAMPLDRDTWLWMHTLYGRIVYGFDALAARPMDFTTRFEALKESYDDSVINDNELMSKIDEAIEAAKPVTERVNKLNENYEKAIANGDEETGEHLRKEAVELNSQLHRMYKEIQDNLLWLDGEMSIIFPHGTRQSNVQNLRGAIEALEAGDPEKAYNDFLSGVGNGWNAIAFDKESVDHFNDRFIKGLEGTWANDRVDPLDCYVDDIVRVLVQKAESDDKEFDNEINQLKELEAEQLKHVNKVVSEEKTGLDKMIDSLKALSE